MSARRYVWLLSFAVVLFAPFVLHALLARETAANVEDALELKIVTPHEIDIRRSFAAAFSHWHQARYGQSVRVVYFTPQGTNDMIRYLRDAYGSAGLRAQAPKPPESTIALGIDLVWGGGDVTFERELKPFLKPVNLRPGVLEAAFPVSDLAGVALYDRSAAVPQWVGVALSTFGIVYNRQLFEALSLPPPTTWRDLTRPELAGLVAMSDPTRSGSAAVSYMLVVQRAMADAEQSGRTLSAGYHDGLAQLTLLAANARHFADTATRPCDDVGQGEAAAAVAIDFYARMLSGAVAKGRVNYVAPVGATAIAPDPIAVLYGTLGERETLANRFIEFLLSPEGQRLWNLRPEASPFVRRSLRRLPIRRDVYADRRGWADDENPFELAQGFNLRKEWMALFRETRELWAAAWLDNQGALADAYRAVLAVPTRTRREELLARLQDLPIQMEEVAGAKAQREALEKAGQTSSVDIRLTVAQVRVSWARRFAEHYQRVETLALEAAQ